MSWLKENWFKVGILLILFIIAFTFYNYLVVVPSREANAIKKCTAEVRLSPHNAGKLVQSEYENCLKRYGID